MDSDQEFHHSLVSIKSNHLSFYDVTEEKQTFLRLRDLMGSHFSQKESVRYTCFCDRNAFFLLTLSTYHLNSYSNKSAPENLKTGKRDKWLPRNNTNVTSVHTQGYETKVRTTLEMSTVV